MELKFGFIFYFYLLTILGIQEKDNYPLPIRNPIVSSVHAMEVELRQKLKEQRPPFWIGTKERSIAVCLLCHPLRELRAIIRRFTVCKQTEAFVQKWSRRSKGTKERWTVKEWAHSQFATVGERPNTFLSVVMNQQQQHWADVVGFPSLLHSVLHWCRTGSQSKI